MDIVQKILNELPALIYYDIYEFELKIYINGNEVRLCYSLDNESWVNELLFNTHKTTFLYLVENIESEEDLINAINETKEFLLKNNLIFI